MLANPQPARPSPDYLRSYPPSSPTRVVLADDHRVMRRSLRSALESERDMQVVAEAKDLVTARHQVQEHVPDVLLLDVRLPNGSSIELIRRVRAEVPETEIVVLTMEDSPVFARHALDAGAIGYVLKDNADSELAVAVRRAARGEEYVSAQVAASLRALRVTADEGGLSERETELLRFLALGYTNDEVAAMLHLSCRTVESHRARIYRKLRLAKRWELVDYALARHLIGADPAIEGDGD